MNIPFTTTSMGIKRQKSGIGTFLFLLLFGIVFSVGSYSIVKGLKIDPSWSKVQGTVINASVSSSDGANTYAAVVEYRADGQIYTVLGGTSSSSYPTIGSQREVAYNPDQPKQAKVVESTGVQVIFYLFPVIGILIIVFGTVFFIKSLHRTQKINNLKQTGQKIQGIIVELQQATIKSNNDGFKVVVAATGPNGIVQNYTSDTLMGLGALSLIDFQINPIAIDVYIDPMNSEDYYVAVENIPNLTPERISELIKRAASQGGIEPPNK